MVPYVWAALVAVALMSACGRSLRGPTETAPPVLSQRPYGTDLRIAATVDTSSAFERAAIACLRRFLANKLAPDAPDDHWYAPDIARFGPIYSELLYAEYDSAGEVRYPPTLLELRPAQEPGVLLLRVRWASEEGADVRYIFTFLARSTEHGVRLSRPIELNTRGWEQQQWGMLRYIISPEHHFSAQQAAEQAALLERLSRFFGVAPFPITYYAFKDPADLFRAKGFEEHVLMHAYPSGGMVDAGDHVYAGNDKDIYTHEIVHLFLQHSCAEAPDLLNEGLATLIGGSEERDYAWHRANMARFLADTTVVLKDRCNTYVQDDIAEHTSVPYMIGALICERIMRRDGKEGLFRVLAQGRDPWPALAAYGITRDGLAKELRKEVSLPMVEVP